MNINRHRKTWIKRIKKSKRVFIMAHKDLDLDAFGSSLGMYELLTNLKKACYLVIDDKKMEQSVEKVYEQVKDDVTIITSREVVENKLENEQQNLLLIVDTNKDYLLQNSKILDEFNDPIIIDHHQLSDNSIFKGTLLIDNDASSTCEMVTDLIEYYNVPIDADLATILLSGIVLDTNNFVIKTNEKTYYMAYYLTKLGADPKKVQYLLKQDLKQYIERQKVITNVKIINKHIALSKGLDTKMYRREELAKIADTLLAFSDIEASFVIGKLNKKEVGISARSMGNMKVNQVLDSFGGGGDQHEGAAKIKNMTIEQIEKHLIKELKKHKKEGDE